MVDIEAVAKTLYQEIMRGYSDGALWQDLPDGYQGYYRDLAQAALNSSGVIAHMDYLHRVHSDTITALESAMYALKATRERE